MKINQTTIPIILGIILGIIGSAAWLAPYVYERFRRANLVGKLVSSRSILNATITNNQTKQVITSGIFYVMKLNIASLNKPFYIKDYSITVKYKSGKSLPGKVFSAGNVITNYQQKSYKYMIPLELNICNMCAFEREKAQHVYIPFIVDKSIDEELSELRFLFKDFQGRSQEIVIDYSKLDTNQLVSDEERLIPI